MPSSQATTHAAYVDAVPHMTTHELEGAYFPLLPQNVYHLLDEGVVRHLMGVSGEPKTTPCLEYGQGKSIIRPLCAVLTCMQNKQSSNVRAGSYEL